MSFLNLKFEDLTSLYLTNKGEEIKEIKYKTEKHDHEIFLKI